MAKGLGRGLSALFADTKEDYVKEQAPTEAPSSEKKEEGATSQVPISKVFPNPDQPRKIFDENALNDLAKSIKEHGVISPLVVNKNKDGTYMIIAGERRYRAAKRAGLEYIPVIVRELGPREIQEISLIENLQREDLNPIEAAYGMKKLMDEYNLTQEVLAERIGKSRPAIANTMRLLTLADDVIALVKDGKLSAGHARTLVPLTKEAQVELARECVKNGWSVRDMERAVKQFLNPPEVLAKEKEKKNALANVELKHLVERLRTTFKTKVSLIGTEKKGRIYIDYYTRDDLERLSEILDILENVK